ncbi:MAG: hypothetical protein ACKORL_12030 [Phycisphaerales bacterium]
MKRAATQKPPKPGVEIVSRPTSGALPTGKSQSTRCVKYSAVASSWKERDAITSRGKYVVPFQPIRTIDSSSPTSGAVPPDPVP